LIKIHDFLKMKRISRGLSLRDVCNSVGISPPYLSALEIGNRYSYKKETINRLANFYDINYESLLLRANLSCWEDHIVENISEDNFTKLCELILNYGEKSKKQLFLCPLEHEQERV